MRTQGPIPPLVIGGIIVVTAVGVGIYLVLSRQFRIEAAAFIVLGTIAAMFLLWWLVMRDLRR